MSHRRSAIRWWRWIAAALILAALTAAARFLPWPSWLRALEERVAALGTLGVVLYGAIYVLAVLLFVPGLVLTLGAGFLFGLARGVVLVSAASTIAAAAAFVIARRVARRRIEDWARRRSDFAAIDRAIGEKGWKIVALLRLSPIVPFSLSNYLYGLTSIRLGAYILTSWLAMLPATVVYVSLGAAGRAAGSGTRRSPAEWSLLALGLGATIVATVLVSRLARRELRAQRIAQTDARSA